MRNIDKAIEVLGRTHDGDDLSPGHLSILESAVNNNLTPEGETYFNDEIYEKVMQGIYKKPWAYGVEHLTKDHAGYIYWKGIEVEHYSFHDYESAKAAAEELARRCMSLEAQGKEVNGTTAIWGWQEGGADETPGMASKAD